jgi:predicted DNA-binding protein (MmcQ/YjbR family)
MNTDAIREFCVAFPHVTEKLQWGDALCFKVHGKMFAVLGLDNLRLSFKCTPETFADLIEREDIHPSPYVGRYKWVKLDRLDAAPWEELRELIRESYEIVAAKTPKKKPARKQTRPKAGTLKKTKGFELLLVDTVGGKECARPT